MRVLFTGIPGTDLCGHVCRLRNFVRETPGYNCDVYDVLKAEQHLRNALARTGLLTEDYQGFSAAFDL